MRFEAEIALFPDGRVAKPKADGGVSLSLLAVVVISSLTRCGRALHLETAAAVRTDLVVRRLHGQGGQPGISEDLTLTRNLATVLCLDRP